MSIRVREEELYFPLKSQTTTKASFGTIEISLTVILKEPTPAPSSIAERSPDPATDDPGPKGDGLGR